MVVVDFDLIIDLNDLPEELLNGEIPMITTTTIIANGTTSDSVSIFATDPEAQLVSASTFSQQTTGVSPAEPFAGLVGQPLETVERFFIAETLKMTGGNREEAAKLLKIGERTLYRKIKEYNL
jgi:two-component system response regulator HydG